MRKTNRVAIALLVVAAMVGAALFALLPSGGVDPVSALPEMSQSFYGTVKIAGEPAGDGITVSAWIGVTQWATTTTSAGQYGYDPVLEVPADDPDTPEIEGGVNGDTVVFEVGGTTANETGVFMSGHFTNLPLTVTLPTGTIEVTCTPAGASFSLSGPASYSGIAPPWSEAEAPVGTYTITWGSMSGYTAPASESKALVEGGTISFSGIYSVIPEETVTTPNTPTGPTSGTTGTSYNYSTGGASSSLGHSLQYSFDWGDGTESSWSSSTSASHSWSSAAAYTVKAQARCATHTSIVSGLSSGLTVTIASPPPVTLVSIAVSPASPSIQVGDTLQFTATAYYSDGNTANVTGGADWSSSKEAVATVAVGLASGVAAGSATITATFEGKSDSATLEVVVVTLASIAVTPESASIRPGRTRQFEATASYSDGSSAVVTAQATWESSNEAVATIDTEVDRGLATGLRVGTATITATFQGESDSATLRVVLPSPPPTITIPPPEDQVIIEAPEGGAAEVVDPDQRTQVRTPDGDVVLDIPAGFVEEAAQVVIAPIDPSEAPVPTAGRQVLRALSITAYDLLGNEITVVSGMPAQLTVSYTDEDLQLVGGDPTRLLVMRYVPDRGWVTLPSTVDTERRLLTVNITTFSMFALGGQMTPGDINVDGVVNYFDLAILGASYGTSVGDPLYRPEADLNGDGSIGLLDLAILAANYAITGR